MYYQLGPSRCYGRIGRYSIDVHPKKKDHIELDTTAGQLLCATGASIATASEVFLVSKSMDPMAMMKTAASTAARVGAERALQKPLLLAHHCRRAEAGACLGQSYYSCQG